MSTTPFRHPLARHAAGTILGRRRDGRPIHAIAGGSGEGGTAPAAPAGPAAPAAPSAPAAPATPQAPAPQAPAAPQAPQQQPAQGEPQSVDSLPDWAQKLIRDTRAEAAEWRTRAQGSAPQAQQQPAAPAAPAQAPAAEGDVSRLPRWAQQAVNDGQGAARQLAIQSAVIQAAPAAGADLVALLDSQSAMSALAAVDPNDAEAVKAAITAAVQANPRLAAQTGPARGGTELGGQPTAPRRAGSLTDAIAAKFAAS
ncbi:hypothetical protein [Streptomyces griseosporeus]|uniref:hypothetical protein n=1 Tax=Streptomyces griseosporeus TaxID=1910 RepID=UPI0036FB96E9